MKAIKDNSNNPGKKFSQSITESLRTVESNDIDLLSLGTILEEISGINQMCGRKMVFISNYPEKLDKALLRPGRIDYKIKLTKCTKKDTISIIKNFLNINNISSVNLSKIPDKKFTAAQVVNFCKSNNLDSIIRQLCSYEEIVSI
jgi:ATP-dependent 26S proteasome regulatory subunit